MGEKVTIEYELLPPTEETVIQMEGIRFNSYGIKEDNWFINNHYQKNILDGKMLVFACKVNDEIKAGCYVSITRRNMLFIEHLFVALDCQETGLRLGRNLLTYVHNHKKNIEEYFSVPIQYSYLEYGSTKAKTIYEKIGYCEFNNTIGCMKKAI